MTPQQQAVDRLQRSRLRLRDALTRPVGAQGLAGELLRLVQQHPWLSLLVSTMAGAALVRARPWRWLTQPQLWAALLPGLLGALAAAPLGSWVDVFTLFVRQAAATPAATKDQSPAAPS